jgi:hypothetical protein
MDDASRTPGIPKENVREIFNKIALIVFNYDQYVD